MAAVSILEKAGLLVVGNGGNNCGNGNGGGGVNNGGGNEWNGMNEGYNQDDYHPNNEYNTNNNNISPNQNPNQNHHQNNNIFLREKIQTNKNNLNLKIESAILAGCCTSNLKSEWNQLEEEEKNCMLTKRKITYYEVHFWQLTMIDEGFNRRGWIFCFQPSQTPKSNVKDSCIFPSLSRLVTKEQERPNQSYFFKGRA